MSSCRATGRTARGDGGRPARQSTGAAAGPPAERMAGHVPPSSSCPGGTPCRRRPPRASSRCQDSAGRAGGSGRRPDRQRGRGGGPEPPRGAARPLAAVAATTQAGREARRHYRHCKVVTAARRKLRTANEKARSRGRFARQGKRNGRPRSHTPRARPDHRHTCQDEWRRVTEGGARPCTRVVPATLRGASPLRDTPGLRATSFGKERP